jgi:hypothetical protein
LNDLRNLRQLRKEEETQEGRDGTHVGKAPLPGSLLKSGLSNLRAAIPASARTGYLSGLLLALRPVFT